MTNEDAYYQGFVDKCAEYGIDKEAAPLWLKKLNKVLFSNPSKRYLNIRDKLRSKHDMAGSAVDALKGQRDDLMDIPLRSYPEALHDRSVHALGKKLQAAQDRVSDLATRHNKLYSKHQGALGGDWKSELLDAFTNSNK